jgi:MoaA/NifB/PqqE/SkfB family radical SAM enzyme
MKSKIAYYMRQIEKLENGEYVAPITCEIDPSNRCMLDCSFCMYSDTNKRSNENLDFGLYCSAVSQLSSMECRSITFTGGGEPLMNLRFNAMAEFAKGMGFQLGLITNGILSHNIESPEYFKFIRISINAGNRSDYKKITGKDLFHKVLDNVQRLIERGAFVGLSYVVCPDNVKGVKNASALARELGVKYIQFKPAWINGAPFNDYEVEGEGVIDTRRYVAKDYMPCLIAHLIGIIGADARMYFCCQYRGDKRFDLGSIKDSTIRDLWAKRLNITPDIESCPQCRYMNYARAYEELRIEHSIFSDHKDFL